MCVCVWGAAGLCVFMADVYMEAPSGDGDQRPHELHRFLVHGPDGRRLESVAEKRQAVFWCLVLHTLQLRCTLLCLLAICLWIYLEAVEAKLRHSIQLIIGTPLN